ncbi:MAG: M20/M25/M40 family metallo-hydrolase [Phyllobacteriaceae bacterium]|nr:M20/M25/M40 family metallo-hydrolase [Phyllobacteriaceae bacterium]
MSAPALLDRLEMVQDRAKLLDLIKRAVACQSITGREAEFVSLLQVEMDARRLEPKSADFLPGRPNIWGERKGTGGGPRLQFIGHTDVVNVQGWRERWAGTEREDPFGGAEVDGSIWGRGSADLKGGICAALGALDLLDAAGLRLKGDLAFAFVGDEESGEPGTGVSAGIARWSDDVETGLIPKPDFAIYVEPTQLDVYSAQIGFFIADVTVTGRSAYFGRPELGVDALKATHAILASVWDHAAELERLEPHPLTGKASVLVTGIDGGGLIAVPGGCHFSVIGSLRPGDDLDAVTAGFEAAIRQAPVADGIAVDIAYSAGRDHPRGGSPAEINAKQPQVALLQRTVSAVMPGKGASAGAPYWSENPFIINKLGVPAVYCAPGDISNCHTSEERLDIEEYLAAVRAFALFAAAYCGVEDVNNHAEIAP